MPFDLALVPEPLKKHVTAPLPLRMMAARGLAPIPPKDLLFVQCALALADEADIAEAARAGLRSHPDHILARAIGADMPGPLLDVLGDVIVERDSLVEPFVLNPYVSDDTLARLANKLPAAVVQVLFQNEQRLQRSEALVRALRAHGSATPAMIDRMVDFLVRQGVVVDGIPEFLDALIRLSPDERDKAFAQIEVPPDLLDTGNTPVAAPPEPELITTDLETGELTAPPEPPVNEPLLKRISKMNIAQKIAVAMKGNKEVRTAMIRDTNKLVAVAAIKNPRITEQEVKMTAMSRQVNEEVIRLITMNNEWTKSYGVKLALLNNPKTPMPIAMRFLPLMRAQDIKGVAKSKNLPSALVNQAKATLNKKK